MASTAKSPTSISISQLASPQPLHDARPLILESPLASHVEGNYDPVDPNTQRSSYESLSAGKAKCLSAVQELNNHQDHKEDKRGSGDASGDGDGLSDLPYHIFSLTKKRYLVYIVSLAGLFSPLSSNIYLPALVQISKDLNVSISLIGITITVYMVVQGLAPSFWGPLSDTYGRRLVFVGTFILYLAANIGLGLSNSFIALVVLRGLQAAGSAATISIGAGVIGDITSSKERGGLIGIFGGLRMMGQSVGPIFGGIITEYFGYRAIFWFLLILGSITVALIFFFLPETLRSIAGNGSIPLTGFELPFMEVLKRKSTAKEVTTLRISSTLPREKLRVDSFIAPMRFLFEKDVFATLLFGGIVYAVWSMVTASSTGLFKERFALNNMQLGLIFLPNGAGCVTGSYFTGLLMDFDYKVIEARYRRDHAIPDCIKLNEKTDTSFPIEKARLRNVWWIVAIFIVTTAAYGFSLNIPNMALPLVLQFIIAYTATALFSLNSALVIDLYPGAPASATAVNNLMRCSVGALGVAVVQLVIDSMGAGFSFLLFAGITGLCTPLLVVAWFYGPGWRGARIDRFKREAVTIV